MTKEALERLAALPLFAGVPLDALQPLIAAMRERTLAAGELLCGRGDPGDRLFVVIEGRLRVSVVTAEGRELSMRIAGAGEMVGEIAAFDGRPRTTDMTAIAPTRVSALPSEAFFAALDREPLIARNALKMLCGRLRDTTSQLETIALYPIEQRLARLLLVAMGAAEPTPGRRTAVALDLSQTEIAQLLGATRSKVNVALGRLEQRARSSAPAIACSATAPYWRGSPKPDMRTRPRRDAALAGAAGVVAVVAAFVFDPTGSIELLRARVYDRLLAAVAPTGATDARVVVLDIDEASLAREGPWPWRRERIARLIEAARAGGAAAIGVDILFATPDAQSPAALARKLAEATGNPSALAVAEGQADDDARLAEALAAGGVALGFALDPDGGGEAPTAPTLARGAIDLGGVWSGGGGVYPLPILAKAAALGLASLPGDADGVVRRAPLFADVGGVLKPGLALETVRLARGASAYVLEAAPRRVRTGEISVALPRDGMLRLAPAAEASRPYRRARR